MAIPPSAADPASPVSFPAPVRRSTRSQGGRAAKPDAERRGMVIAYRATPAEAAEVEARAEAAGLPVSVYVRDLVHGRPYVPPRRRHGPSRAKEAPGPIAAQLGRAGGLLHQAVKLAWLGTVPAEVAQQAEQAIREIRAVLKQLAASGDDPAD